MSGKSIAAAVFAGLDVVGFAYGAAHSGSLALLTFCGLVAVLGGLLVLGLRIDRRNSVASDIQAQTAGAFDRDVLFGRRDAWVVPTRTGWQPHTLTGQPELSAQPAPVVPVEVEEGAA